MGINDVYIHDIFLVLTDSRKHNSEHRLIIMPDNLSPLSNIISALFEV